MTSSIVFGQIYVDSYTNETSAPDAPYWGAAPAGMTVTNPAGSGSVIITGDGTSATFQSISVTPYDNPEMSGAGTAITAVDMAGTGTDLDTIYVVAKSSVDGTVLRLDVKDASDYVSNAGTIKNTSTLGTSFQVHKFFYTAPTDGAFGGTGCATAGCVVDLNTVKEFLFYVDTEVGGFDGTVTINYFQVGGTAPSVTVGVNAAKQISASKLFPNPASSEATVELNLHNAAEVKVTLTDMMGREVKVIADKKASSLVETFSVAGLTSGLYTVNYFIDGAPAKAELLMVK